MNAAMQVRIDASSGLKDHPLISRASSHSFTIQILEKGDGVLAADLKEILEFRHLESVATRKRVLQPGFQGGDLVGCHHHIDAHSDQFSLLEEKIVKISNISGILRKFLEEFIQGGWLKAFSVEQL